MEPINVDFTHGKDDDGNSNIPVSDVYIPPRNAKKKIIINLILTAIFAAVTYYFMIPALNFKAIELYMYIAFICLIYIGLTVLSCKVAIHPEYQSYVKKHSTVPGIIMAVLGCFPFDNEA